jgi:putative tRNA adenosine deaminase-associated protein
VPYFNAVFAKTDNGWIGAEADLTEASGLEDVVDLMREAAVEASGDLVILFAEANDEWFAVARTDDEEQDARIFLSDPRAALTGKLGALLYDALTEGKAEALGPDPIGDAELLEDLGVDGEQMLTLSEGLPGESLAAVAATAGFPEEYDRLR